MTPEEAEKENDLIALDRERKRQEKENWDH